MMSQERILDCQALTQTVCIIIATVPKSYFTEPWSNIAKRHIRTHLTFKKHKNKQLGVVIEVDNYVYIYIRYFSVAPFWFWSVGLVFNYVILLCLLL